MSQIEFNATIDPKFPPVVPDAVSFETGATRAQAADPSLFVYEHHGDGFGQSDPGALTSFFEDLIQGRPMPPMFAARCIGDIDTIIALALFLDRTLAIHPAMPGFVYSVDLVHRRGPAMMGHIDPTLGRFLKRLRIFFADDKIPKRELGKRIGQAVEWIRLVLDGHDVPCLDLTWPKVRILDVGTNGFVLAESSGLLGSGWVELYRLGHLRGMLVDLDADGRRHVLVAKKSAYVKFNLTLAAEILNDMERAMGELPDWTLAGPKSDPLWLWGPNHGTLILVRDMLEVLKRV